MLWLFGTCEASGQQMRCFMDKVVFRSCLSELRWLTVEAIFMNSCKMPQKYLEGLFRETAVLIIWGYRKEAVTSWLNPIMKLLSVNTGGDAWEN